jgi:urease accessory protein
MDSSALLRLIWLASPALPVGGFSYSEGLEAAVNAGMVYDEASCKQWLLDQLHLSLARSDLPVVLLAVNAIRSGDQTALQILDNWVRQSRESAELRLQTEQMGKSLGTWAVALPGAEQTKLGPHTYPVSFAQSAALTTASTTECGLAFAFAWAENMVGAAVRSVPLGQTAGQRVLHALAEGISGAITHAQALGHDDLQAFTPMLAILSAQHEHQYSRLFRS